MKEISFSFEFFRILEILRVKGFSFGVLGLRCKDLRFATPLEVHEDL